MTDTTGRCGCGNKIDDRDPDAKQCEWCAVIADEPPHVGHWSLFGGWWCDTCDSPLCDLA